MYYQPRPISSRDQMLMNRIDRLHLEPPHFRRRMLLDLLRQEGRKACRSKVSRLIRRSVRIVDNLYKMDQEATRLKKKY